MRMNSRKGYFIERYANKRMCIKDRLDYFFAFQIINNNLYISQLMKGIVLLVLFAVVYGDHFYFRRVLDCLVSNTRICTHWNESTSLTYSTYYTTYCLSEHTSVLTPDGPRSMRQLTIGDQIWSFDTATGKQGFSKLVAWLHRDTRAITSYDLIQTDQHTQFQASDFHNIAFVNGQHKIDFKFAHDLNDGDQLVGFPEPSPFVSGNTTQVERRGLYTPFTETGNYYIFNTSSSGEGEASKSDPMILVHALSQVKDPASQMSTARAFLKLSALVGLNRQPSDDEPYLHPLYSSFTFLFGQAWHPELREAKYEVDRHFQALPPTPSPSKPSPSTPSSSLSSSSSSSVSSSGSSSTIFGASTFYSSTCSGSSSSCEADRQDKMQALGLSVSIVQEIPLL